MNSLRTIPSTPKLPVLTRVSGLVSFSPESRGDPIGSYPTLLIAGVPYNAWLTDQVLIPILHRWAGDSPGGSDFAAAIPHDLEWSSRRARLAFQEILPAASSLGEPAVLAALSVTSNLQRTVALLGEFLLTGRPPRDAKSGFELSRLWCGLIAYEQNSSYFPAPVRPPTHAARLPLYRDPRHLTNAFWCTIGDVERECGEGLAVMREAIQREGAVSAVDLRHLHPHAAGRLQNCSGHAV